MSESTTHSAQSSGAASRLAAMLMELDDLLVSCMRCGMCQAVCPVYGTTMREADVTRGKIALLENLAHSMIADAEGVNEKLNRCLLCGSCQANCPSGVKIMDIFLRARTIVSGYMGLSPVQKIIFRGLLTKPGLFNSLLDISGKLQGLFIKDASKVVGTSCSSLLKPFIGDRHFAALAKESFHSKTSSLDTPAGASGLRVAFFPGSVTSATTLVPAATLKAPLASSLPSPAGASTASDFSVPLSKVSLALTPSVLAGLPWSRRCRVRVSGLATSS